MTRVRAWRLPPRIWSRLASRTAKSLGVAEDARLDGLLQAGAEFGGREGGEQVDVGEDGARLVEAADEVFAGGEVDAGLAADGGVDLGEEGGRDLDEGHAAHVDGGEEAGDVADDAAAECDEERIAVGSGLGELLGKVSDGGEAFVFFRRRGRNRTVGDFASGKLARTFSDQSSQMFGLVMRKGRKGFPLARRTRRWWRLLRRPVPMVMS